MENKDAIRKLEQYRADEKLTKTDMANKIGIAVTQYSRWINTHKISRSWVELLKAKGMIKE
jgi:hypothetical protein